VTVGPESGSTQQLVDFLALISSLDDEREALRRGVERAAEALDAEAAALVRGDGVPVSVGFAPDEVPEGGLVAIAEGGANHLDVPGIGRSAAVAVPLEEGRPLKLVVARHGEEGFNREEIGLLRGMARVLALGLRSLRLLDTQRALRDQRERQAEENARLLAAVRERQVVLEHLARIQRLIVNRAPLRGVLDAVVEAGCELLGEEFGALRLVDPDDERLTTLVASVGATEEMLNVHRRARAADGLGARAMSEKQIVVARGADARDAVPDFAAEGLGTAVVAPVYERERVVGSLGVASARADRTYDARDQQILLALAEHASLALNDARAAEDLVHEAFHDSTTGLANRTLFLDRLGNALARAERASRDVGVLFVDLDGFNTVNDSLGHGAGDQLLGAVGDRLAERLRPADTIARLGGDEFGILLDEVADTDDAAHAAGRVLEAFERPFELHGRELFVTASVGVAAGRGDPQELLRDADLAMYRAKANGKDRYQVFEPAMHTAAVDRLELEVDLKRAIERDELVLHYQPIFDLRGGGVAGLEALVRWHHPSRGLVLPDSFVPLAEESGMIHQLGRWVLRKACRQGALWRAKYPAYPTLEVTVNLSATQLQAAGLFAEVESALADSQLEPGSLVLEITETALTADAETSISALQALRESGVKLAMDDFGTGYSSLAYLSRFPIDTLKIAQVFIEDLGEPSDEPAMVRAMVELAEIFGLRVIAEGIERPEQADALLRLGCELGQGHHLSRPLTAEEADALLFRAGLLGGEPERADEARPEGSPSEARERPEAGA
jgi:diguanylate cyclase (GGDEF)-like protein